MDKLNLIKLTDEFLTREQSLTEERLPHFYPSEARAICEETGAVLGSCLRASYYRLTSIPQSDPPSARFHYIFMLGNLVEAFLIDRWKEMGLWVADGVRFHDHDYNVSGKTDCFIRNFYDRKMIIGVEVKSFYGYHATNEIMGSRQSQGRPKIDQLLQTLFYAERYSHVGIPGFKMAYLARDSVQRREFNVIPVVTSVGGEVQRTRPAVDGTIFHNISVEGIRRSYRLLDQAVGTDTLPARDFQAVYNKTVVEAKWTAGDISKSKYNDWKRSPARNPIGDWRCSYCWWQTYCYKDDLGEEITLDAND